MTEVQPHKKNPLRRSQFWMRAISFAGLHRILSAVARFPGGLRASEINRLVQETGITLTRRCSNPAPTTLYHYRNTLISLCALKRHGRVLRVNADDPEVVKLVDQSPPAQGENSLSDSARDSFAALVLKNKQCRSLFFDLFLPTNKSSQSVGSFCRDGIPVKWTRERTSNITEVVLRNEETGRSARFKSRVSITAILYGVRYWARDELGLIDEYNRKSDSSTVMFPLLNHIPSTPEIDSAVLLMVRHVLSLRTPNEWTLLSIFALIVRCCEKRRQPKKVLFAAIEWLVKEWPHHIVLIPTSRALATLTSSSSLREEFELKTYYKISDGPYISHIRLHKDLMVKHSEIAQ